MPNTIPKKINSYIHEIKSLKSELKDNKDKDKLFDLAWKRFCLADYLKELPLKDYQAAYPKATQEDKDKKMIRNYILAVHTTLVPPSLPCYDFLKEQLINSSLPIIDMYLKTTCQKLSSDLKTKLKFVREHTGPKKEELSSRSATRWTPVLFKFGVGITAVATACSTIAALNSRNTP